MRPESRIIEGFHFNWKVVEGVSRRCVLEVYIEARRCDKISKHGESTHSTQRVGSFNVVTQNEARRGKLAFQENV